MSLVGEEIQKPRCTLLLLARRVRASGCTTQSVAGASTLGCLELDVPADFMVVASKPLDADRQPDSCHPAIPLTPPPLAASARQVATRPPRSLSEVFSAFRLFLDRNRASVSSLVCGKLQAYGTTRSDPGTMARGHTPFFPDAERQHSTRHTSQESPLVASQPPLVSPSHCYASASRRGAHGFHGVLAAWMAH